jgi:oligoendopeptidase F
MAVISEIPQKRVRTFVAEDFVVTEWSQLKPYLDTLQTLPLETVADVEDWLLRYGELEAVANEDGAWRFINMTRDTDNSVLRERYMYFISEIIPKFAVKGHELQLRLYRSPGFQQLDPVHWKVLIRLIQNRIRLYNEENIQLAAEVRRRSREFDALAAGLHIEENGEKITQQRAAALLEVKDRAYRQQVWQKITASRLAHRETFNDLYSDLIQMRHRIALNAGFSSYADYKFAELGRFDYTRADCYAFHDSVEKVVRPELERRSRERAALLGLDRLRPWDLSVDELGCPPLTPFKGSDGLMDGVIRLFERMDPRIAEHFRTMQQMGHLDLESRLGKAPGGYNYSLPETGVPFIFMNAVGTQGDLTTMLHETGHAIHSFATHKLRVSEFKQLPAEIAELASMSMELLTMDYLDEFYPDPADVVRAKRELILRPINLLPWIAAIDAFQWWVYDNPAHTIAEREQQWISIFRRFHGDYVDWSGYEHILASFWQKQGHVFEVPFYYIEYGIAQLGAVAVWRNSRQHPAKGLQDYLHALSLGYSRPIPEIYAAAGAKFDLSEPYIRELIDFSLTELQRISR